MTSKTLLSGPRIEKGFLFFYLHNVFIFIKEMNIKDQVDKMVADSQKTLEDNFNTRLTALEQKQADLSTLLDAQIKQMKDENLISAKTDLNATEIDNLKTALGIDYTKDKDGKITGVNLGATNLINQLTAKITETGKLVILVKDKEAKTIGNATIKAGDTSVEIKTKAVDGDSKIFTNISAKISDAPVLMAPKDEIDSGKSFKVEINDALKVDVNFNWWIVETNSSDDSSSSSSSPISPVIPTSPTPSTDSTGSLSL